MAELLKIDENLARAELTDAQRADHHVRREAILIRRGETRETSAHSGRNADKLSAYSKRAAADLGVDERTVRRDLRRGTNNAPDVLAEVTGSDLDKGVVLDQLASTPKADQPAKLAEIRQRHLDAELEAANLGVGYGHNQRFTARYLYHGRHGARHRSAVANNSFSQSASDSGDREMHQVPASNRYGILPRW